MVKIATGADPSKMAKIATCPDLSEIVKIATGADPSKMAKIAKGPDKSKKV